jgi:hypothetical protein
MTWWIDFLLCIFYRMAWCLGSGAGLQGRDCIVKEYILNKEKSFILIYA